MDWIKEINEAQAWVNNIRLFPQHGNVYVLLVEDYKNLFYAHDFGSSTGISTELEMDSYECKMFDLKIKILLMKDTFLISLNV